MDSNTYSQEYKPYSTVLIIPLKYSKKKFRFIMGPYGFKQWICHSFQWTYLGFKFQYDPYIYCHVINSHLTCPCLISYSDLDQLSVRDREKRLYL